jgi:hypothetical protein
MVCKECGAKIHLSPFCKNAGEEPSEEYIARMRGALQGVIDAEINTAVFTAIRDTKLSIARELYDEAQKCAKVARKTRDEKELIRAAWQWKAYREFANRLAIEALGLDGI